MGYTETIKLLRRARKKQAFVDLCFLLETKIMDTLTKNKDSLLYNEKITAKRLGIGYSTLKVLRRDKRINHVRIGRRVFYRLFEIEAFISRNAVEN